MNRFIPILFSVPLLLACSASTVFGQTHEMRSWTDLDGRVVEAALVSADDTSISIKLPNGQMATVAKSRLSKTDLDYLKQAAGTASRSTFLGSSSEPAFFSAPIDPDSWKENTPINSFGIANYNFTSQLETPHLFITCGKKIRDSYRRGYAEAGERIFYQIKTDFPALGEQLEGRKLAVWLSSDRTEHRDIESILDFIGQPSSEWGTTSISYLMIDQKVQGEYHLYRSGRGFNVEYEKTDQDDIRWAERIHFMASTFVSSGMPYYSGEKKASWEMFELCYCYYLERIISGRIKTKVKFTNEADAVEGFKYGWEVMTKKLLARSPMRPSIIKFTTQDSGDAEPIDAAFGYGLMKYMLSDPQRKTGLNEMLAMCITEKKTASAEDYVKAMGAESVEDFDAKWYAYLVSPEF